MARDFTCNPPLLHPDRTPALVTLGKGELKIRAFLSEENLQVGPHRPHFSFLYQQRHSQYLWISLYGSAAVSLKPQSTKDWPLGTLDRVRKQKMISTVRQLTASSILYAHMAQQQVPTDTLDGLCASAYQ